MGEEESEKEQSQNRSKSREEPEGGKQWKKVSKGGLSAVGHSFIHSTNLSSSSPVAGTVLGNGVTW